MSRKFSRSYSDSVLFGVCGGLAEYTKTDSLIWRVLFVLLFFTTIPIGVIYLVLALITD